jgi:hypothetical protein
VTSDQSAKTGEVRALVVEAARTQLAAVTAATKFWSGWVQAADKFAVGISNELARLEEPDATDGDTVGRLTDLTRAYLRELTTLPTLAVNHFNTELEKVGQPRRRRARAARIKE